MSSIQVYKLLTDTVGKLNGQAVALMNGQVEKEAAKSEAIAVMTAALAALEAETPAPAITE